MGVVIRGIIGRALFGMGCQIEENPGCMCPYHLYFKVQAAHGATATPFRLDCTALDGVYLTALSPYTFRMTTFCDPGVLLSAVRVALAEGLGGARIPCHVTEVRALSDACPNASEGPLHLLPRAAALLGEADVVLATPMTFKSVTQRRGQTPKVTLPNVLHSIHRRMRDIGLSVQGWPYFTDVEAELRAYTVVDVERWSGKRQATLPLHGVQATWRVTLGPAEAWWLAVGEVVGVGKSTSYGMGCLQVIPLRVPRRRAVFP